MRQGRARYHAPLCPCPAYAGREGVADGEDLDEETLAQLVLLLRELRAAEGTIEVRIARLTSVMASGA
jgi:hypothetical protein